MKISILISYFLAGNTGRIETSQLLVAITCIGSTQIVETRMQTMIPCYWSEPPIGLLIPAAKRLSILDQVSARYDLP